MRLPSNWRCFFDHTAAASRCALPATCLSIFPCHAERNAHLPNNQKRFINPHIGSQLLRFAVQRGVRSLEVAHRLWDLLREQRSKASRVSMRVYLIAMQRRDIDNPRVAQVHPPSFYVSCSLTRGTARPLTSPCALDLVAMNCHSIYRGCVA